MHRAQENQPAINDFPEFLPELRKLKDEGNTQDLKIRLDQEVDFGLKRDTSANPLWF